MNDTQSAISASPHDIIGSPTYQMNLVLWMTSSNNQLRVPPVLANAGFKLLSVERTLPLSEMARATLEAAQLDHIPSPTPDFLLHNKKSYVILECKRTMFGTESSTAAQCRSLVVLAPRELEQSLGDKKAGAISEVHLLYLARCDGAGDKEIAGIIAIRQDMLAKKIKVASAGLLAISATDTAIHLCVSKKGSLPSSLRTLLATTVKLHDIEPGVDPRMLYVIPWVPQAEDTNEKDEYHRIALAERVKIAATQIVDRERVPADVYIRTDDIIANLLGGVEKLWRNTKALRQIQQEVTTVLARQLAKIKSDGPAVLKMQGKAEWAISLKDAADKEAVVTALMSPGSYLRAGEPVQLLIESPSDASK